MTEQDASYTDWVYDNTYQLTSDIRKTSGGSTIYSRTFTYDQVGNRTQMVKDGQTVNYTYDANNKMTVADGDSYTYDNNGNTIGRTGTSGNASWTYDYENRMLTSTTPQGSATLVYNGEGLRVQKTEAGVVRKYLFDGVRIYSEHDAGMVEQARFVIERDSYYSPLTAIRTGGAWYYPLYDSLGSTRRLINASQTVTDSYSYDAFGNITSQSGATYNPYRYVGSLGYYSTGTTTGLMHLGARYYNPLHGRFATRDPGRQGVNWYAYVDGRPTVAVDPNGALLGMGPIGILGMASLPFLGCIWWGTHVGARYMFKSRYEGYIGHCVGCCIAATCLMPLGPIHMAYDTALMGLLLEVFGGTGVDPQDLVADRVGIGCAFTREWSCTTCCKRRLPKALGISRPSPRQAHRNRNRDRWPWEDGSVW